MQFGEGPYSLKPGMQKIHDIWGADWEPDPETSKTIAGLQEGYPTRKAALIALEAALTKKQPGPLGEIIDQ